MKPRFKGTVFGLCLLLLMAATAAAQQESQPASDAKANGPDESLPRVSMIFDHPDVEPNHFEIVVDSAGNASYSSHSESKPDPSASTFLPNEDLERRFTLSPGTRDRIFQLTKVARYFDGDFDFTKSKVAFTGKKTLSYMDAKQARSTTYNWSENAAIDELGSIFLGISSTLETGSRLERMLQHEKLALNGELARLEESGKNRQMREIQLIAEVLQQIASDQSVMGVARRRAERLLQAGRR